MYSELIKSEMECKASNAIKKLFKNIIEEK